MDSAPKRQTRYSREGPQPQPEQVDLDSTIVLTSVLGILAGVLTIYGKVAELPADPCGTPGYHCVVGVADAAGRVASWLPVLLFAAAVALSFRQRRRGGLTWPIPLLGLGLTVATVLIAALVSQLSVGPVH